MAHLYSRLLTERHNRHEHHDDQRRDQRRRTQHLGDRIVIVTALEIAAAAPHAVDHAAHETPAMIVAACLAVGTAFRTDTNAIIIMNVPTISLS